MFILSFKYLLDNRRELKKRIIKDWDIKYLEESRRKIVANLATGLICLIINGFIWVEIVTKLKFA